MTPAPVFAAQLWRSPGFDAQTTSGTRAVLSWAATAVTRVVMHSKMTATPAQRCRPGMLDPIGSPLFGEQAQGRYLTSHPVMQKKGGVNSIMPSCQPAPRELVNSCP